MIKSGNAEWEENHTKACLRIIWKKPETLAGEIYNWACNSEILGTVFTVYELHSGEENLDSGSFYYWCINLVPVGFHGTDPVLMRRALDILVENNKVAIVNSNIHHIV